MDNMTPKEMDVLTDFFTQADDTDEKVVAQTADEHIDIISCEEAVIIARREQAKYLAPYFEKFAAAVKGIFKFFFMSLYSDLRSFRIGS